MKTVEFRTKQERDWEMARQEAIGTLEMAIDIIRNAKKEVTLGIVLIDDDVVHTVYEGIDRMFMLAGGLDYLKRRVMDYIDERLD